MENKDIENIFTSQPIFDIKYVNDIKAAVSTHHFCNLSRKDF